MKASQHEGHVYDTDHCEDRGSAVSGESKYVSGVKITKPMDTALKLEKCKIRCDNAVFNSEQTTDNRASVDTGNVPYLVQEGHESPCYRIGKCQTRIQESPIQGTPDLLDLNNNVKQVLGRNGRASDICKPIGKTGLSIQHQHNDARQDIKQTDTPTTFVGLFQSMGSQQLSIPAGVSDIDIYRQSYLEGGYSHQQRQQQQQFINHESPQQQAAGFGQYTQYEQAVDDDHIAAEQLASELCSTYSGPNSHMISDILKRNVGQNYVHSGFERPNVIETMQHFDNIVSNQNELQDVDLLNTPQQLPAVEEVCQDVYETQREQFGDPRASSTPDVTYQKNRNADPATNYESSVTYNDIHVHGGRWSSQKSPVYDQQVEPESPFPDTRQEHFGSTGGQENFHAERVAPNLVASKGKCDLSPTNDDKHFLDISDFKLAATKQAPVKEDEIRHIPESDQFGGGFKSPGSQSGGYNGQPQHEITKMTFTPREMMETHLSENYKYQKKSSYGQQVSDYSSIYPSRDFIERATNQSAIKRPSSLEQRESLAARKRARVSKYSTEEVPRVPPQMPIFDSMFQKYVPYMPRDEMHGGKHKYFVVNPSEISHMPPKTLMTKYIDFLISENEQITAISKSTNPPVDIYVTEDMYFMDSLKFKVPFPSKKFVEWVASFYPRLNFTEMKFKGQHPTIPLEGQALKPDPRPTQEILEDTFYFFQREAMNMEDQRP